MSLPILVTPAAKLLQTKPSAPATPSDKASFSKAIGAAERRGDAAKPAAHEPAVREPEAPQQPKEAAKPVADAGEKAPEQEPQAPQAEVGEKPEPAAKDETAAQAPVDVQMLVAVASQLVMPVAQSNLQTIAQPVAQQAVEAAAPAAEVVAPAPVQVVPAAPVVQQVVAEQAKATEIAANPQEAAQPQGTVAMAPVDGQGAIAPTAQSEAGEQQDASQDANSQTQKGPKPPVMPVAPQQVHQSIESLRASDKVATLVTAHEPAAMAAKAPLVDAADQAQDAAAAALVTEAAKQADDVQPAADAVRPWQLPHAVGGAEAQAPQAQVIQEDAPTGEAMPMREAMRLPFAQAAKDGKPSELRLQLSPEHLGRMEIRVMSHEGALSAQIRVDHAQAREMMQVQLAELRQSLADQGIKIDKLEVSVGQDRRQDPSFAFGGNLQQQAGQQQQQAQHASNHRTGYYGADVFDEAVEEGESLQAPTVGVTAVDYQA